LAATNARSDRRYIKSVEVEEWNTGMVPGGFWDLGGIAAEAVDMDARVWKEVQGDESSEPWVEACYGNVDVGIGHGHGWVSMKSEWNIK
jgi:hypothetical protein